MFIRRFNNIDALKKHRLFIEKLNPDVLFGCVFPTVRKDNIDFYYEGGVLFRFEGSRFKRSPRYCQYTPEGCLKSGNCIDDYEVYKKENECKFSKTDISEDSLLPNERQYLARLNKYTFGQDVSSDVVVLDVEIRLNIDNAKKCDLVLLNTRTGRIMFVEGKIMQDSRMACKVDSNGKRAPKVVEQVEIYSKTIENNADIICKEYGKHIRIINDLFGTTYESEVSIVKPAKLLVYRVPAQQNENRRYSIEKINELLGKNNVMWNYDNAEPLLDEIWKSLSD
jgi:hypothetical protein